MRDKQTPSNGEDLPLDWDSNDEAIVTALNAVSPPSGALERARERLRAESSSLESSRHLSKDPLKTSSQPVSRRTDWRSVLVSRRALAIAATLAIVAASVFFFRSQPVSRNKLATYCITQLDVISAQSPTWNSVSAESASQQLSALLRYSSGRLTLVGVKEHGNGGLAKSCQVWKFRTNDGKSLYVFEFLEPRRVSHVTGQLEVFGEGSSWSLAALQLGDQLLVTAVSGDIDRYFRRIPFA